MNDLSPKNCHQLKNELLELNTLNNKSEDLRLALITLLDNKSGPQRSHKISIAAHSSTLSAKPKILNPIPQTKPSATHWRPWNGLVKLLREWINQWREVNATKKNKKKVNQNYQIHLKKLSIETHIKQFATILCDIGLLYGQENNLPKKNPNIEQLIENFSSTHPLQIKVLVWLNSPYYHNATEIEKRFIQQNLDNILSFNKPEEALHALCMLYYCNFHTEEQFNRHLASHQAKDFIELFLEKLYLMSGKPVSLLKTEIEANLYKLNPPETPKADKIEEKKPENISKIVQEAHLESECIPQAEAHSQTRQIKYGPLFSFEQPKMEFDRPISPHEPSKIGRAHV